MKHEWTRNRIKDLTLVALFAVLAIIGGKISLPFLLIPFTLQTAVCMMTGLLLGWRKAMAAQSLYVFMGLVGLPVFAAGGGPAYVLQPSFGYLAGMILAAGLIGFLTDRADPERLGLTIWRAALINLAGLSVIYLFGVTYLYGIKNIYAGQALAFVRAIQVGMLPFLLTDGIYAVVLAAVVPVIRRATRQFMLQSRT